MVSSELPHTDTHTHILSVVFPHIFLQFDMFRKLNWEYSFGVIHFQMKRFGKLSHDLDEISLLMINDDNLQK